MIRLLYNTPCCTPFDPLVDTETRELIHRTRHNQVAPPSIRLWILKQNNIKLIQVQVEVAPPSIRLWILKQQGVIRSPKELLKVAPPSIRLWILKHDNVPLILSDIDKVAPPSIRLWILKHCPCKTFWSKGYKLHPLRSACGY